jgi:pullulanase/glycogen debranching enzyme
VVTGLFLEPNETNQGRATDQLLQLLELKDLIRLGLAGNLAEFLLVNRSGEPVQGSDYLYRGASAARNRLPQENIPYLEAHDNETLFDAVQYKAPINTPMTERVRIHNLGISLLALSQGLPFFHAGMEILRSKSLERDSYDSGDWFNHLDFTYQENNWGIGLPFFDKNGGNWPVMKRLLSRPALKPEPGHIQAALHHFEEMLTIRRSSPLFRLSTAEAVIDNLRFLNTGPNQEPALVVMSLGNWSNFKGDELGDPLFVVFNFGPDRVSYQGEKMKIPRLVLHPVLTASADPVVHQAKFDQKSQRFSIPPRTTAVFLAADSGGNKST